MGVLHAEEEEEIESQEDGNMPVLAHKDNISILVASSDDLIQMNHHTSVLDHQSRSTADTACTTHGCSPEVDKR